MILKELFVKLGLDVDEAAFAKGQLAAGLVEAGMHKLVEVATEVVHAFQENVMEAIEYGDKIHKTSQAIGVAAEALQELQYAGKLADLSAEQMSQSIGILSRKMLEAKDGGEEAGKAFKGIAFQEGGKLKATEEVLGAIADRFAKMEDGPEKTAQAMQLFGRAGKQMIPLLNKGSEALEEMRQEARDLGLVMGDKAVEASEELNDNLHRLHMLSQGIWRQAIEPLIPALNELVEKFLRWRKENGKILAQRLTAFLSILIKGFHILADTIDVVSASMKYMHAFMPLIIAGVAGLTTAIIFLKREAIIAGIQTAIAWAPVTLAILAISAAVAGLFLVLEDFAVYQRGKGKSVFGAFVKSWDDWLKKDPSDGPLMRFLKDLLSMLGKAQEIVDDIGFALQGNQYFIDKGKRQGKIDEQGNFVGNKGYNSRFSVSTDTAGKAGTTGLRRRGQMTIDGKTVREADGLTPDMLAHPVLNTPKPSVRAAHGGGGHSSTVHAPVQVGPIIQQPGESSPALADRLRSVVGEVVQSHIEQAIPAVKR